MTPAAVFRRAAEVLETSVNDDTVLLHSTRWQYLHFTGTGRVIWQLLATPTTFDELISSLRSRFEVDDATCRKEVEIFIQKLLDEEFVTAT